MTKNQYLPDKIQGDWGKPGEPTA